MAQMIFSFSRLCFFSHLYDMFFCFIMMIMIKECGKKRIRILRKENYPIWDV